MAMALNMFLCMLWLSDHLGIMPEVSFVNPKVTIWFRDVFVCDGGGAGAGRGRFCRTKRLEEVGPGEAGPGDCSTLRHAAFRPHPPVSLAPEGRGSDHKMHGVL